jgi:hypothetical protein
MKSYLRTAYVCILALQLIACGGGGDVGGGGGSLGNISTNYPYLTATPQITYVQNVNNLSQYDVTVTAQATGPNGVYSISLWIQSTTDNSVFESLDLQHVGGNTWTATTNVFLPLPAGSYYLDSIMVEDGDAIAAGQIRSSWYVTGLLSNSHYEVDQRLTDRDIPNIIEYNLSVSNIPVVTFTLP